MVSSAARVVASGPASSLLFFHLLEGLNYIFPPLSSQGDAGLLVRFIAHPAILRSSQLRKSNTVVDTLQLRFKFVRPGVASGETVECRAFY